MLLIGCASTPPFDFAAACGTAEAPASTAADLRRIEQTVNDASNGDYQPKGEDVAPWRSAVLLAEAARLAAAPYALPTELQGNLPPRPDTTEVRRLQEQLRADCRDRSR